MRVSVIKTVFLAAAITLVGREPQAAQPGSTDSKPNIVLFLADDLGWTGLKCFGSDFYETPHLDRMAAEGTRFTAAYAACTVCSPTRASIMTGMYPARLKLTDFIAGQNRPFARLKIPDWTKRLESRHLTIAERLSRAGYRTAHVGKWHLSARRRPGDDAEEADGTEPTDQGFDVSYQRPVGTRGYFLPESITSQSGSRYLTDYLTDRACEFIDEGNGEPFFLYFAYHVPHTPIQGRQDLVDYFAAKVKAGATHNNPTYAAMVSSLDSSVGRVVERLEANGYLDDTMIVFISDNGGLTQRYGKHDGFTENLPLRRGKGSAYEGGVRVPMIVRYPKIGTAGTRCDEPVMTIDLFPTFSELAGLPSPSESDLDGRSLLPLLENVDSEFDRNLYWHYPHYHAGGDGPYSAIRSGDYRLIEFHEDDRVELYNLEADLSEGNDLSQQHPQIRDRLRNQLHRWRETVGAQMPTPNPNYQPERAEEVGRAERRR